MVRVKYGALITDMKGKSGGTIFQGGRSGGTARNLGKPRKSVSPAQTARKQVLANRAGYWRLLKASDRAGWNALASTLTRINRFGDPYTPTGYQIFMEFNLNLFTVGATSPLEVAPTLDSEPVTDSWELTIDVGSNTIRPAWNYVSGLAQWTVVPFMFWNQGNGIFEARGSQTQSNTTNDITAGNVNLWDEFGKLGVNLDPGESQLAVVIRIIHNKSGQAMAPFQLISPVQ